MSSHRLKELQEALDALKAKDEPDDVDTIAEAFARALSRFTTADGALKVADQGGQSVVG